MTSSLTHPITFSANDLADYFGVDRQTIYRMRADGRLPSGFIIGRRIRRWSLPELVRHSEELKEALAPYQNPLPIPANDN
jgi:excisionase family DNA binding protein